MSLGVVLRLALRSALRNALREGGFSNKAATAKAPRF